MISNNNEVISFEECNSDDNIPLKVQENISSENDDEEERELINEECETIEDGILMNEILNDEEENINTSNEYCPLESAIHNYLQTEEGRNSNFSLDFNINLERVKDGVEIIRQFLSLPDINNTSSIKEFRYLMAKHLYYEVTPPLEKVSLRQIAQFFGVTHGVISSNYYKFGKELKVGRPSILTIDETAKLQQYLNNKIEKRKPPTYSDIYQFILREFNKFVHPKTIVSIVKRLGFKSVVGKPEDDKRFDVDQQSIYEYFQNLMNNCSGISTRLIINMDESGFSDWADRKEIRLIVPNDYQDNTYLYPVNRTPKRITMVAAISAGGDALKPALITSRKTIDTDLFDLGYTNDVVKYYYQSKAFLTKRIFRAWIQDILIPYVIITRQQINQPNMKAILIMDNFSGHMDADSYNILQSNNITIITIPPHSSHLLQPLDLGIFGIVKGTLQRISAPNFLKLHSARIVNIIDAFRKSTTRRNIISAFQQAAIFSVYINEFNLCFPVIDINGARRAREIQQLQPSKRIALPAVK